MSAVTHAVIAAAGLGSRLGRGHPKCLLEFEGETILERQLKLLKDVEDVRVVVGFEEQRVAAEARKIRNDITIVRNPSYRSTTTLQSYALGAKFLIDDCLFMDADILFEKSSFDSFLNVCVRNEPLIAITAAKTTDAVFTHINEGCVVKFSRTLPASFEWANLCWLPPKFCETGEGAVFERISLDLPVRCHEIISFEIDTPADHMKALQEAKFVI